MLDLVLAHEHTLEVAAGFDGEPAGKRGVEAVGDRARLDRHRLAGGERGVQRLARLRLDGDDPDAAGGPERRNDTADQPTAADGDDHRVGIRRVLLDLEADRARAGDHDRVVERVDERAAGLLDQHGEPLEGLGRPGGLEIDRRAVPRVAAIFSSEAPVHITTRASTPNSAAA